MTPVAPFTEGGRIAALPMYDLPGLEAANNAFVARRRHPPDCKRH